MSEKINFELKQIKDRISTVKGEIARNEKTIKTCQENIKMKKEEEKNLRQRIKDLDKKLFTVQYYNKVKNDYLGEIAVMLTSKEGQNQIKKFIEDGYCVIKGIPYRITDWEDGCIEYGRSLECEYESASYGGCYHSGPCYYQPGFKVPINRKSFSICDARVDGNILYVDPDDRNYFRHILDHSKPMKLTIKKG